MTARGGEEQFLRGAGVADRDHIDARGAQGNSKGIVRHVNDGYKAPDAKRLEKRIKELLGR